MSRPPVKGGTDDLLVGSRVQVSAGPGIIRWTGVNPAFAAGKWVGVELCVSLSGWSQLSSPSSLAPSDLAAPFHL